MLGAIFILVINAISTGLDYIEILTKLLSVPVDSRFIYGLRWIQIGFISSASLAPLFLLQYQKKYWNRPSLMTAHHRCVLTSLPTQRLARNARISLLSLVMYNVNKYNPHFKTEIMQLRLLIIFRSKNIVIWFN